jgi:hypothetical protein
MLVYDLTLRDFAEFQQVFSSKLIFFYFAIVNDKPRV